MPVSDLLVIAAALEVPPVALIVDGLPNGLNWLLPNHEGVAAFDAVQWISGERQTVPTGTDAVIEADTGEIVALRSRIEYLEGNLGYPDSPFSLDEANPSPEVQILQLARELQKLMASQWSELDRSAQEGDLTKIAELIERVSHRRKQILEEIKELGGDVSDSPIEEVADGEG